MENRNVIIILILVIVILALSVGILFLQQNSQTSQSEIAQIKQPSTPPDTIKVELTEFDKKFTKSVGEYTVEAEKWKGGSVGGFGVWLYKNGQLVDKDSYLSRAYFYMDGEWKWSDWGNME